MVTVTSCGVLVNCKLAGLKLHVTLSVAWVMGPLASAKLAQANVTVGVPAPGGAVTGAVACTGCPCGTEAGGAMIDWDTEALPFRPMESVAVMVMGKSPAAE